MNKDSKVTVGFTRGESGTVRYRASFTKVVKRQFFSFLFFSFGENKQLTTRTPSFALAAYCPAISSRPTSLTILGTSSKSASKLAVHTRKNWHKHYVDL